MPKAAPRKTIRQKALKLGERFDWDVLGEDGELRTLFYKVLSTDQLLEMGQEGPVTQVQ